MLTQQEVVFARNERLVASGAEYDVLIEAETMIEGEETSGVGGAATLYQGRTYQQAPDIDAATFVRSSRELAPGEIVRCKIMDSSDYDLIAQPVDEAPGRVSLPQA
ncbi:MAG: hypothetical protein ACYTGQ_13790 [Planctomycetota bacterium]|jgi:ribosomal protein S12 methylthiotransferase